MGWWNKSRGHFFHFSRFFLPAGAAAVLLTVIGAGWFTQPDRFVRGYKPIQPIAFSHRLHGGSLHMPCEYCHSGVLKSRVAGIPATEKCMNCHRVTKVDQPEIKKLAAVVDSGKPLEWKRIHSLPDHVYFDHRPHAHAGILCQTCHGEVQTMTVVYQNMSMRMSNCLGCHWDPGDALLSDSSIRKGPDHCYACHR